MVQKLQRLTMGMVRQYNHRESLIEQTSFDEWNKATHTSMVELRSHLDRMLGRQDIWGSSQLALVETDGEGPSQCA